MGLGRCNHVVCIDEPGRKVLLMGNEAYARGAIEAGVKVATAYPGTPSSEIVGTIMRVKDYFNIYAEWSVNEKVAAELAYGASIAGLRALTAMKHYGLNVALDFLTRVPYIKTDAGYVIISADDPQSHSSGSEQDSRFIGAYVMEVPVLEPSNPQEAKDMTVYAFDLSEQFKLPVLIRSVTRVGHARQDVVLGEIRESKNVPKIPDKHALIPGELGVRRHRELHVKILKEVEVVANNSKLNYSLIPKNAKLGIITSGVAYEYVLEAINLLNLQNQIAILKMGFVNPLPSKVVENFIEYFNEVLIVEEGEPYLEVSIKSLLFDRVRKPVIYGKLNGVLPRWGELSTDIVIDVLSKFFSMGKARVSTSLSESSAPRIKLPKRRITLCPGCPHRATGYALKMAIRRVGIKATFHGDIGCYALVGQPPLSLRDTSGAMGSSIGIACGIAKSGVKVKPIALIGDSTIFHAGLPALANIVYDNSNVLVVVFDNRTTAMTGHQPHPGTEIEISEIAKAMGIKYVEVVDPYDVKRMIEIFEKLLRIDEPSLVVARHPCALVEVRVKGVEKVYTVNKSKCVRCKLCVNEFGCPAIYLDRDGAPTIDPILCIGCGVCAQICPVHAIEVRR